MRSVWTAAAATLAVLVGCAGGSGSIGSADGGTSSSGGSSGGSSSGGGSDGGGGPGCSTLQIPGTRACVPRAAKANTAITLEVEGQGCLGCGKTFAPCKVTVEDAKVFVKLEANQCPLPEGTGCDLSCQIPRTTCSIPPLPVGSYRLEIGSGAQASTDEPRMLNVTANGEGTTCSLPQGSPPPISTDEFPKTCTVGNDSECSLVVEGDVCKPCVCPSGAIATSANADYQAEINARRAACTSGGGSPSCAPCQDNKVAKCVAGSCTVVAK